MTNESDRELAARLRRLADAVPVNQPEDREELGVLRPASRSITSLPFGALIVAIVLVLGAGLVSRVIPQAVQAPAAGPSLTPAPQPSSAQATVALPTSEIDSLQAADLARGHVDATAKLLNTAAGSFADVDPRGQRAPGYPIASGQLVWAVTFNTTFVICPPGGSACMTPRPGTVTVFLDYITGKFLTSSAYSAP